MFPLDHDGQVSDARLRRTELEAPVLGLAPLHTDLHHLHLAVLPGVESHDGGDVQVVIHVQLEAVVICQIERDRAKNFLIDRSVNNCIARCLADRKCRQET